MLANRLSEKKLSKASWRSGGWDANRKLNILLEFGWRKEKRERWIQYNTVNKKLKDNCF